MTWQAGFTSLRESTKDDWDRLVAGEVAHARALPGRVLAHLRLLDADPAGFPVNRLQHSLQAATLALNDGRGDDYVVCALLHDIGDTLGSYNHPEIAAAVLQPFVDDADLWMVRHHGTVQGHNFFHHIGLDRDARDALKGHLHYERCAEFVALYDDPAFDPQRPTLPLEAFEPLLQRVFATPKRSPYLAALPGTPLAPRRP